jgi:hypothetical protein
MCQFLVSSLCSFLPFSRSTFGCFQVDLSKENSRGSFLTQKKKKNKENREHISFFCSAHASDFYFVLRFQRISCLRNGKRKILCLCCNFANQGNEKESKQKRFVNAQTNRVDTFFSNFFSPSKNEENIIFYVSRKLRLNLKTAYLKC